MKGARGGMGTARRGVIALGVSLLALFVWRGVRVVSDLADRTARTKSEDHVRSLLHLLTSAGGSSKPLPPYEGKAFVLALVATGEIDRRSPRELHLLFSWGDADRRLEAAGGVGAYARISLESLRAPDPGRAALTSYAGPRRGEVERAGAPGAALEGIPLIGDLSFPDGAIVGFADGRARWLDREALGLGPDDPIVAGDGSRSPLLQRLSSD